MRKFWFLVLLVWFLGVGIEVSAYSAWTDQFVRSFEQKLETKTDKEQKQYLELISTILSAPKIQSSNNTEIKLLVKELTHWLWTKGITNTLIPAFQLKLSDGQSYQTLENIDFDQVRGAWLQWHNDLRATEGLEPYRYHSDLEKSAKSWSDQLANLEIKSWTHKRKETDGYYSYPSIKERFSNLGIFFPKETGGRSAFSESVGYRSLNCASNDCTDALIRATKRIFETFAAEGKGGAHYKAIMMPHFTYVGLGFQLDSAKKTVYVVIHYAGDLLAE